MASHEGACSKDCCILCFNVLVKNTDRNLVNGKNKVVDNLNDLPFCCAQFVGIFLQAMSEAVYEVSQPERKIERYGLSLDIILSREMRKK